MSRHNAGKNNRSSSNLQRFRQESDRKYLYLVVFTLVVVGGGLIAFIFGPEPLLTALPCLLGGAVLIFLPWAVLSIIQRWRDGMEKRARLESEVFTTASGDDSRFNNSGNQEKNDRR